MHARDPHTYELRLLNDALRRRAVTARTEAAGASDARERERLLEEADYCARRVTEVGRQIEALEREARDELIRMAEDAAHGREPGGRSVDVDGEGED